MSLTFKRNFHLIALLILLVVVLILVFGGQRIVAYTIPDNEPMAVDLAQIRISSLLSTLGIH